MIPTTPNGRSVTPSQATRGAKGQPKTARATSATPTKAARATPVKTNKPQKPRTQTGRFK